MNLPPPFQSAVRFEANAHGSVNLLNSLDKVVARIPLGTAFELFNRAHDRLGSNSAYTQHYGFADCDGSGFGDPDMTTSHPNVFTSRSFLGRVTCKDGFTVSIQASARHYSLPRVDEGPWTHVELGYPSQPDPLISGYAEDFGDLTQTAYPYVPQEVVSCLIQSHGGVDQIT